MDKNPCLIGRQAPLAKVEEDEKGKKIKNMTKAKKITGGSTSTMEVEPPRDKKNPKGYTFVEIIVTMFVFVVVMVAVAGIHSSLTKTNRKAVLTQRDLEQAQYALNLMAKTIRTSSIVTSCATPPCTRQDLVVFDNSRSSNRCVKYSLNANTIETGTADSATKEACESATIALAEMIGTYVDSLNFYVTSPIAGSIGKVTIVMRICSTSACTDEARLQTTVSLRKYKELAPY